MFLLLDVLFLIFLLLFINSFSDYPIVQHALAGVRVCVCVLVLDAIIKLAKKSLIDAATYGIFAAVLLLSLFTGVSAFVWVIAAGAAGIMIKCLMENRSKA